MIVSFISFIFLSFQVSALTLKKLTKDDLIAEASEIKEGRFTGKISFKRADDIYTKFEFINEKYNEKFSFVNKGGSLNGKSIVYGIPLSFVRNKQYGLFLKKGLDENVLASGFQSILVFDNKKNMYHSYVGGITFNALEFDQVKGKQGVEKPLVGFSEYPKNPSKTIKKKRDLSSLREVEDDYYWLSVILIFSLLVCFFYMCSRRRGAHE